MRSFLAEEIGEIVVNLVGDAQTPAKSGGGPHERVIAPGQPAAKQARQVKKLRGLQINDAPVFGQRNGGVAPAERLGDFTGTHPPRRTGYNPADLGRWELRGQVDGMGQQRIAQQNRGIAAVAACGGRTAAAEGRRHP